MFGNTSSQTRTRNSCHVKASVMDNTGLYKIGQYSNSIQKALNRAIKFQQNVYELSGDWTVYEENEHELLKNNIKYCCPLPQCDDSKLKDTNQEKYDEFIDLIYTQIIEATRDRKKLHVGIVFNVLCITKDTDTVIEYPVPVFKVQHCFHHETIRTEAYKKVSKIGITALHPYCVRYIDTEGRVYQNWTDYVGNNTLPASVMVLPMGGHYQVNPEAVNSMTDTKVWLEIGKSSCIPKILGYTDVASSVLGFGSCTLFVAAALSAPIAAPVLIAGTVCGAATGLYSVGRSVHQLVDRGQHQQSISLADDGARSAWFGLASGVAGGLASGSTVAVSKATKAGFSIGKFGQLGYNAISIGNIMISGMGVGNGIYSIYKSYTETGTVSKLEIAQVVAQTLFFGSAVVNYQTAQQLIRDTQQRVLQDYESSLRSNRHRKAFRRIQRNTRATNSDVISADTEIIRGIRTINNKDDFFASCVRNRRALNAADAEITFKDGYAMINDNLPFDPIELSQKPMEVRINTASAAQPLRLSENNAPVRKNCMSISDLFAKVETITPLLKALPNFDLMNLTVSGGDHIIEKLVLEMCQFPDSTITIMIENIAKIALRIVIGHRHLVRKQIDELMWFIWEKVKSMAYIKLESTGIDISGIKLTPELEAMIDQFRKEIVDELANSAHYLQDLIDDWKIKVKNQVQNMKCSICKGFYLEQ